MKLDWNFQKGVEGNVRKNSFYGRGMDIFWNRTSSFYFLTYKYFVQQVEKEQSFAMMAKLVRTQPLSH